MAAAAGLLALPVLAYLWPVLIGGRTLAPTALLYADGLWRNAVPAGIAHFVNADLADVPISYYPWDVLARRLIHAGTFPAWNPYALGGTPLFANFELAWLSPFSLPLWVLPLNYGLGVAAALKLWAAGLGTYLLARELRLGFWPGIVAGTSFALCAFDVVWLSHGVFVSVAALLPWTIWLAERIARRGRPLDGLLLAGAVAVAVAGGHPGTLLHVLAATALYALARTLPLPGLARGERLRRLGLVACALLLGTLLTAVALLPAQRAAAGTIGEAMRSHGSPSFPSSMLPFRALRTALLPDWWGRPSEQLVAGPVSYKERTFFAGSVALVLAAIALVSAGGWRRKAPFALLGALGVAIALRAPGLYALVIHAPLFDQVQNGRILLLFQFAVAVLAGFGLQELLEGPRNEPRAASVLAGFGLPGVLAGPRERRRATTMRAGLGIRMVPARLEERARAAAAIAVALLIGVAVAAWLTARGDGVLGLAIHELLHRSGRATPDALALASVGWFLVPVGALAAILALAPRAPERRWLAGAAVALLAALEMLHFAHGFQPMGPASQILPPRTPAIAFLQRHADDGRIAGVSPRPGDWMLQADVSTVYGLRDARGFDAPQPTLRFLRFWRLMDPKAATPYFVSELSARSARILGVLGTRYLLVEPGAEPRRAIPGLRPVYRGADATIYANARALPRAFVASSVAVARDEDAELAAVGGDSRAVVRQDELAGLPPPGDARGVVRVVGERTAAVALRARLTRRGLVVLDDAWAPGWTVRVDGRPAGALQADVVLRGVVVPAGVHTIVWTYRVPGLRLGAALSGAGLLVVLAWSGWLAIRARRAPRRG